MNMTKHMLRLGVLLLGIGLAAIAHAADECQLNLSDSRLDFGLMNRAAALVPTPEHLLGKRHISLNLNCPQPTDMSLFYRGLAADVERLRFTELGSYGLRVGDAMLDGQAVELGLLAGSGQAPGMIGATLNWRPGHGIVPIRAGVPMTGRSFSLQIDVSAWAMEDAVRVRDAITWETSGLFDAVAAGHSRELSLQARFAPAACAPSLSNGGTVDFGKLSVNDLNADNDTVLPDRQLIFAVACNAPTHFALRMQDNRQGSATGGNDETAYGLGLDARQQKIGRYYLNFNPARITADSLAQVYRTDSTTAGVAWSSASSKTIPVAANSYLGFTASPGSTAGPSAIQNLSAMVSITAFIAPLKSLDLSNEIRLDGSGTLEIVYL